MTSPYRYMRKARNPRAYMVEEPATASTARRNAVMLSTEAPEVNFGAAFVGAVLLARAVASLPGEKRRKK